MVESGRWQEKYFLSNFHSGLKAKVTTRTRSRSQNLYAIINAIHYFAPISITRMLLLHIIIIIIMNINNIELLQKET